MESPARSEKPPSFTENGELQKGPEYLSPREMDIIKSLDRYI